MAPAYCMARGCGAFAGVAKPPKMAFALPGTNPSCQRKRRHCQSDRWPH